MNRRIPLRRGSPTGFLLILLGLWGGLVPFVGPYFDYALGANRTWHWTTNRLWLEVLPAAVVVLGGLLMFVSRTRGRASLGGLLALAGGVWFVIGPSMSMLWHHGTVATGAPVGGTALRTAEWIGFFYGTGALITLLAAYALGFLAALPVGGEAVAATDGPTAARGDGAAERDRASAGDGARTRREPEPTRTE
jgi:hypothetical protein